jgi:hypothetical protein
MQGQVGRPARPCSSIKRARRASLRGSASHRRRDHAADLADGLMSYGVNSADLHRRAAPYVDSYPQGREKSPWVSGGPTVTAFRSAHLKIAIACSPETIVTVAAIIVIPVTSPVRCSIRIPLLPAPVRSVPSPVRSLIKIPLHSSVLRAAPTGAGRGIAFGGSLPIGPLALDGALAAVRSSLVLASGRSRLRPFGIR